MNRIITGDATAGLEEKSPYAAMAEKRIGETVVQMRIPGTEPKA